MAKETIKKRERERENLQNVRKYLQMITADKDLISKIHKQLIPLKNNNKKPN